MAKLLVTPPAEADISQILDHLDIEASPSVADNTNAAFVRAFEKLITFRGIGTPRAKFGSDVRNWTVEPFVIYYRYADATDVVRTPGILHGRRNVTSKLIAGGT